MGRRFKKKWIFNSIIWILTLGYFGYLYMDTTNEYIEINSIPENDIYLYEEKLDKEFKSIHSGVLKYKTREYRYYWHTEDNQKENPPILEIKNNGGNEELHITFKDDLYNKGDKLHSIINLNTRERIDRYESDVYLKAGGVPIAISVDYTNEIGIESKTDTDNLEIIYLEKIKEYDYFIIRNNKNEKNPLNFLVRTEFGRVQNIVELPKGAIYKDHKTSPYEMYMAINFTRELKKGIIKNSISIIELQDHDHTKLLTGQMNNELNVGEFSYFISDYRFVDNRKFLVIKPNSEKIYFELDPQRNHLDDLNLDKNE
ncbi:hypothetical protein GOQ27_05510 [Clostridium sp. D2Q-11]|uniref:Uncharacterized protein n=1 Tax=Anaeromonas frigoriresistens TaxID=2683708 RepID=A0A942Z844_9FIRM|nr:hypothetical protein [Anaeromonas frigoriresistens]MBS4537908.1 hypothetical protein [Anaeromonas frigoriresistens]